MNISSLQVDSKYTSDWQFMKAKYVCSEFSYFVDETATDDVEGRLASTVEI